MTTMQLIHWVCAFIVMAEALNKLERTTPFANGMCFRSRLVTALKAMAWLLMAMGAGGALIGPFLQPMGIVPNIPLFAHLAPSLAEVCTMAGFAALIIRTRLKEG